MVAHFSGKDNPTSFCNDPKGCEQWSTQIEIYMTRALAKAEKLYTAFLTYDHHRLICLDEKIIEEADHLQLSWRLLSQSIRGGYLLEWYDREEVLSLQLTTRKKQECSPHVPSTFQMTVGYTSHLRSKTVFDPAVKAEYAPFSGRYHILLRCEISPTSPPLIVECVFNDRPVNKQTWAMQVVGISVPSAEKWAPDFSKRICRCAERNNDNVWLPTLLQL